MASEVQLERILTIQEVIRNNARELHVISLRKDAVQNEQENGRG